jgi:hypothetical protein
VSADVRQTTGGGPYPEITMVCTDGGQHRQVVLGLLTDFRTTTPPGRIVGGNSTARVSRSGRRMVHDRPSPVSMIRENGHLTYTIRCPRSRCTRNVQLREESLAAVLDRLYVASPPGQRRHHWDISEA